PWVLYQYDTDFKGSLYSVTSEFATGSCPSPTLTNFVSSTTYTHDGFGRIASSTQTTKGALPASTSYPFTYNAYSLTDQLLDMTYPSGRRIHYSVDHADRVTAVQNVATQANYATIQYTTPVGNGSMTMGNGVVEQATVNDRGQLTTLS